MTKVHKKELLLYELSKNPIVTLACKKVGISRNTFYQWSKNEYYRELTRQAVINGENYINDLAEIKLFKKINNDEYWPAIKYRLDQKSLKYNNVTFPPMTPPPKVPDEVTLDLERIDKKYDK
jgi:hypothetical protein